MIKSSFSQDEIKESRETYSAQEVSSAWQKNTELSHLSLMLDDSKYYGLPLKVWQDIMKQSDTRQMKYIPEFRDCDDFAFAFKGELVKWAINGVGLVFNIGGKHAFNVAIISNDGGELPTFKFIEPQNDEWIITESRPLYNLQGSGFVII